MNILDGKAVSEHIETQIQEEILSIKEKTGKVPGLAVIIVGDNSASQAYVKSKDRLATKLGLNSRVIRLDQHVSPETLTGEIASLNNDDSIDAVLVQLPLPHAFNTWAILDTLDPQKDVDRFHPINQGMVILNRTDIFPCTPFGILKILDHYQVPVAGKHAVIIGRSFIVGKPMAAMMTNRDATVTLCHSKTKDLASIVKTADIVIAAVGKPATVTPEMVKDHAVLIDVGMNYLYQKDEVLKYCTEDQIKKFEKKGYGITGDIHRDAFKKSSFYTPVPGGIGLMTVIMLMVNTLELFKKRRMPAAG
ncbi:MAG: bifunctional 5,10-methylenetetrahydrofolate dehydrogenase/5,10-methenyltetrahydrofolate cyclohydrolase [Candidatus Omnitrophota bacterium]